MTLDVVPGAPHVFQAYAAMLDEGEAALSRAADFLINGWATGAAQ
jgi:monoterpene epsilon-lactone hydrolase